MDEDEGLKALIVQRSQRQSYARMISWEFNDADQTKLVTVQKRRRRRSKQQSGETTQDFGEENDVDLDLSNLSVESFSGSEDEFFSAEELLVSDSESVTGESASGPVRSEGKHDVPITCTPRNESEDDEDLVFTDENSSLSKSFSNVRQRLSKKQKKKRRKEICTMYENHIRPFMEEELDDIVHMLSDRTLVDKTIDICKNVPSLVQLCIKSSYKINLKSMPELPNKIKQLFYPDKDFSVQKIQLSWLHSTMARFEANFAKACLSSGDKPELLHIVRDVQRRVYSVNHESEDKKADPLATLQYTYMERSLSLEERRTMTTWAVVTASLALMMPPFLSDNAFRHQSESEDDRITRATRSVVARLKSAMKKRFPSMVSYCFDDAVPYALWARGDINMATEYFMSLSQNTTKEILKAVYLNEVGRMHTQIGAVERASKFYRLSCDSLLKDGKNSNEADDITTNMLMLVANLNDQGILSIQKGSYSRQAWKNVWTNRYRTKVDGLERHIMDVYLCTHCGSLEGREWLEEAKSLMGEFSTSDPQLVYYLSMIHALLGEEKQSHTVYWEFVKSLEDNFMDAPGRDMVSLSGKGAKYNPWKPLVNMVKEIDNDVHFLPVLWRVQLHHLNIASGVGFESDLRTKTLDLHFDSSRYLTGNMQMFLPPIRRIRLNPYTGTLQFDQHKSPTKVFTAWDSTVVTNKGLWGDLPQSLAPCVFVIPTMLEVYNSNGINVHLVLGQNAGKSFNGSLTCLDMATLIWTGPNGEKARLNIFKILREHSIKEARAYLLTLYKRQGTTNDQSIEDGQTLIDLCIEKNRLVEKKWIIGEVQTLHRLRTDHERKLKERENRMKKLYEPKKGKKARPVKFVYEKYEKPPALKLEYKAHPTEYRLLLDNLCVVGDRLIFTTRMDSTHSPYLWVIDLTSKEAFMACTAPLCQRNAFIPLPVRNQVCFTVPGANILLHQSASTQFEIIDITKKAVIGGYIQCDPNRVTACSDINGVFTFGSQLLGITFNSRIWSWCSQKGEREFDGEFTGVRDLELIGRVLVVSTDVGIKFCSVPKDPDHVFVSLPVVLSAKFSGTPLTVNDEGSAICNSREKIKVTGTQREFRDGKEVYRAAVCLDNITVILLVPTDVYGPRESAPPIEILMAVTLPGYGTESCFISQQGGVLLGWTHHKEKEEDYREHLFQVDYQARLIGVLPLLGYGPRGFLLVYLPGDEDIQSKHPGHGQPGWYVFMRDGYEGIIGIKLNG